MPPWDKYKSEATSPPTPWSKYGVDPEATAVEPNGIEKMLQDSGIDEADFSRLMSTGITPGTAAEFAAAHIQGLKTRGIGKNEQEQVAIHNMYAQQAGNNQYTFSDGYQDQQRRRQATEFETLPGRALAQAKKIFNFGPQGLSDLTSIVSPSLGNEISDRGNEVFGTGQSTSSARNLMMDLAPEAAKMALIAPTGPAGMATLYGGQGFGGQRREVAQLRAQGKNISTLDEFKTAVAVGGVEAISGYIGGRIFHKTASVLKGASPTLRGLFIEGDPGAVRALIQQATVLTGSSLAEGTEESVTQLVTNAIRSGVNPEVALEDGLGQAFAMGALLAPLGAATAPTHGSVDQRHAPISDAPLSRIDVARIATDVDPDVKDPSNFAGGERNADGDKVRELTLLYFDTELKTLDNGNQEFAKVSVPLDKIALGGQYQPDVEQQYAQQSPDTAPPAIGGFRGDHFVLVDGNTRARAARLRGESTIEVYTPITDGKIVQNDVITDTNRLLEGKDQQQQIADIKARGDRETQEGLALPSSGTVFQVSPQGIAGTAEQQAEAQKAGEAMVPPPQDQLALPAPTARFQAGTEGVADLNNPYTEQRDPANAEGRQKIDELRGQDRAAAADAEIARLRKESRTDPLTGAGNKRAWDEGLGSLQDRVNKRNRPGHFLMFDAANLKAANDALGHEGADQVLKDIATKMQDAAGPSATVVRQGGDEFGVIFSPGTSKKKAKAIMAAIEAAVGDVQIAPGVTMFLSGGLGTARPNQPIGNATRSADTESETRKREKKQALGESTTREAAEAGVKAANQVAAPVDPRTIGVDTGQTTQTSQQRAAVRAKFHARMSSVQNLKSQQAGKANHKIADMVKRLFPRAKHVARVLGKLTGKRIARAYDTMVHDPDNPEVKASYDAFKSETLDQFNRLKQEGMTFDTAPVVSVTSLYPSVTELSIDIGDNQHLTIDADPGDMPANHPLMEIAPGTDGLTYNQVFRAVHDVLGHGPKSYGFNIPGEENAWRSHSSMYSDLAKGALATETRGQSSWVGYGPNAEANVRAIEEGRIEDVVFPSQKAGLLPRAMWTPEASTDVAESSDPEVAPSLMRRLFRGRRSARKVAPIEGTQHKRRVPKGIEDFITPLSSRVRDLAPAIFNRLMRMEYDTGVARERIKREFHAPATKITADLGGKKSQRYKAFKEALLSGDREAAANLLSPEVRGELDGFYDTFRGLLNDLRTAGVTVGDLGENYWPRFITDYRGFKQVFGQDLGVFEDAWALARSVKGGRELSSEEKADIANQVLQGYGPRKPGSMGIANSRERTVDQVDSDNSRYYLDPIESALRYVDGITYAVERNKFLGKNAKSADEIESSVGDVLRDEVDAGNLNTDQQEELRSLLVTRFTADMVQTSKWVRNLKQMVYLTTLGQFRSTLTQLTDVAFSATTHGLPSVGSGVSAALHLTPRDRRLIMEDIGVHDHGEEFKDVGRIARTTDWVLRKTGFKTLDRFGKESRINAARHALQRAAAEPTSKEYARIKQEYGEVLPNLEQIMRDLRSGKITEDVKYLVFLDIAKIQPLTPSQMPERYLAMPNGRILYTLKTFTIQQLDFVRRDMIRKLTTPGQRKDGVRNLGRYLVFYTMMGLGVEFLKDWLRGEAVTVDSIPDSIVDVLLGSVGLNRYTVEQAWSKPSEAAVNFIAPPMSWFDAPFQDITSGGSSGLRSIRMIPIVGELLYFWAPFGGGYQKNRKDAEKEYKNKLSLLERDAKLAQFGGDTQMAHTLMGIYNERRQEVSGVDAMTVADLKTLV